jgi:CDP-6-deoxy-D-xylo-4-hexulose-3-dehydrase
MSGALGIEQTKKIPSLIAGRRENAAYFTERMAQVEGIRIQREVGESSWFGFSLVLEGRYAGRRSEVVDALTAARIDSRPIVAGNFTRNPVMRYLDAVVPDSLPAADKIHDDGLFVGNHHFPVHGGIDLLAETIESVR